LQDVGDIFYEYYSNPIESFIIGFDSNF